MCACFLVSALTCAEMFALHRSSSSRIPSLATAHALSSVSLLSLLSPPLSLLSVHQSRCSLPLSVLSTSPLSSLPLSLSPSLPLSLSPPLSLFVSVCLQGFDLFLSGDRTDTLRPKEIKVFMCMRMRISVCARLCVCVYVCYMQNLSQKTQRAREKLSMYDIITK